tara:strand:- start:682 stop:1071 length:390 start_codon:yes stop_codon:yes gene_type:complete
MEIGLNSLKKRIIEININTISMIFGQGDLPMSGLEDTFGSGYQQIIIGFVVFILGAFWGGIEADGNMSASDVYWPALTMLAGGMITLLGISFGTDHEDDRTNDLRDAIEDLTAKLDKLVAMTSGKDSEE